MRRVISVCCSLLTVVLHVGAVRGLGDQDATAALQTGFSNPSAVYCSEVMGYTFRIENTSAGQLGLCEMPDGTQCAAWGFLEGRCGREFSYCAELGYDTETRSDGRDPFSREYAVCVGPERTVVGSVVELAGLSGLSGGCVEGTGSRHDVASGRSGAGGEGKAPASFDWRTYLASDWTTPVKNQGGCGSCWAFSAVGVAEAVHNIAASDAGLDWDLSEEYLVSDCFSDRTCCGGSHGQALEFLTTNGVSDEGCFGYGESCTCGDGSCDTNCTHSTASECSDFVCTDRCVHWPPRVRTIWNSESLSSNADTIKQAIVDYGPVSVGMGIGTDFGGWWDGSVYRCTDDSGANHSVVIVGYDDAGEYWIVRNSWGSGWNGDGHLRVGYGECRIEYFAHRALAANTTWGATFGGTATDVFTSVKQTLDGAYVAVGCESSWGSGVADGWIVRQYFGGAHMWSKTFGGANDDCFSAIEGGYTTFGGGGGLVAVGYEKSWGRGGADAWLMRLDMSGNKVWSKTFGGEGDDYFRSVHQTSDGGFIIAGDQASWGNGSSDGWVVKVNHLGSKVWSKTFGGAETDRFYSVRETSDGGFIVAGEQSSWGRGGSDGWVVKLDSAGGKVWSKTFGGVSDDTFRSVRETDDGGCVVGGYESSWGAGSTDGWAVKLDSDGVKEWSDTFGGTDSDYFLNVGSTTDGGWVFAGHESSWGAGSADGWVVKLDSGGASSWSKTFGGQSADAVLAVWQTLNGGYALGGYESSWGQGGADGWSVKLDSAGSR